MIRRINVNIPCFTQTQSFYVDIFQNIVGEVFGLPFQEVLFFCVCGQAVFQGTLKLVCTSPCLSISLRCYSQILCGGSTKMFIFCLFCIDLVIMQCNKKQEILKQSCKDLFILVVPSILWLIIGPNNIFNIDVNGLFAIHIIVHNSLKQNQNRLKFWIKLLT